MASWTCWRALLNWPTLRLGGVFRLRGTTAISQQARAVEGLLGNMSSRSILEGGCRGKMLPRCIFGLPAMARLCLDAFPGARRWQNAREMRSSASDGGNILARCVPGRQSVASFALHASRKWPRTGKSPVRGKIRAPCIRKRAGFGKMCAPCIRKAPQIAVGGYTARISCQEGALFAARAPRIMHGARILPFLGAPLERFDLFSGGGGRAVFVFRTLSMSHLAVHAPFALRVRFAAARVVDLVGISHEAGTRISVVVSTLRPKQRDRVVYCRKRGAVMVFR